MGWMDNIKGFLGSNGRTDDDFEEEIDEFEDDAEVEEEEVGETPAAKESPAYTHESSRNAKPAAKQSAAKPQYAAPKPIIDFDEKQGGITGMDNFADTERSQILLYKPESLEGIKKIADRVNQKKTVILNLENQDDDFIKTVIDFFSGVAYANHGKLSPIADKTYIVTPENIDMNKPEGANIGDSEFGSLNILDALNNDSF